MHRTLIQAELDRIDERSLRPGQSELAAQLAAYQPLVRSARLSLLVAVPGDDIHVGALTVADRLFSSLGYAVRNLGVMVDLATIVQECVQVGPSAIVLSSLNGHALENCGDLPERLARSDIDVPVYVGGRLATSRSRALRAQELLRERGFRCFGPDTSLVVGAAAVTATLLGDARVPLDVMPYGR